MTKLDRFYTRYLAWYDTAYCAGWELLDFDDFYEVQWMEFEI